VCCCEAEGGRSSYGSLRLVGIDGVGVRHGEVEGETERRVSVPGDVGRMTLGSRFCVRSKRAGSVIMRCVCVCVMALGGVVCHIIVEVD
jgi:hypothetical protein